MPIDSSQFITGGEGDWLILSSRVWKLAPTSSCIYVGYVELKRKIDCPKMAHSFSLHWRWYWGGASKQVLGKIKMRVVDFYAIWHWSVFTASCSSVYCTFLPCESAAFPDILKCTDFPIQWMYLFWKWHPDSLSSWPCQYSIGHCHPEKLTKYDIYVTDFANSLY